MVPQEHPISPGLRGLVCQLRLDTRLGKVANAWATDTTVHRDLLIALARRRSTASSASASKKIDRDSIGVPIRGALGQSVDMVMAFDGSPGRPPPGPDL
jgi:hypothetical protein